MTIELNIVEKMTGLVIFEVANQEFCVDINDISAIVNPAELKQTINLNSEEEISIDLNEQLIPLLSCKKLFGFKQKDTHMEDLRILVVELNNKVFGIMVEKVKEIITMSKELKNKLKFVPLKGQANLLGVFRYEGRSLYLPDIDKLILQR